MTPHEPGYSEWPVLLPSARGDGSDRGSRPTAGGDGPGPHNARQRPRSRGRHPAGVRRARRHRRRNKTDPRVPDCRRLLRRPVHWGSRPRRSNQGIPPSSGHLHQFGAVRVLLRDGRDARAPLAPTAGGDGVPRGRPHLRIRTRPGIPRGAGSGKRLCLGRESDRLRAEDGAPPNNFARSPGGAVISPSSGMEFTVEPDWTIDGWTQPVTAHVPLSRRSPDPVTRTSCYRCNPPKPDPRLGPACRQSALRRGERLPRRRHRHAHRRA